MNTTLAIFLCPIPMKIVKFFVAIIFGLTAFLTTSLIFIFAQSWEVYDFSVSTYGWEIVTNEGWFAQCNYDDVSGIYYNNNEFRMDWCGGSWPSYYYSLLIESPTIDPGPSGGKFRFYRNDNGNIGYNMSGAVYQLITDTWYVANLNDPITQDYYIISADATKIRISKLVGPAGGSVGVRAIYTAEFQDIEVEGDSSYPLSCATVEDYHFYGVITDAWLLQSATISDSILTLDSDGIAAQNLVTLTSNSDYNAIISVTNATTESVASVNLILGVETEAITITGSDYYTTTFTTPNLGGPLAYAIENTSAGSTTIEIDYTCLFLIGEGEPECIAPLNGEFNSSDYWEWYREATWNSSGKNAYLPYNAGNDANRSLIQTIDTYSLPTLSSGEYLLLGFQSATKDGQTAVIGSRVADNWQEFDVYSSFYNYEADISSMAGLSATVSFANAGSSEGFPSEDDILLDDVCIFISDHPPGLPGPQNPTLSPSDFGFDYGCPDVPYLLAGYGINVFALQDTYAAGVTVWDPENWVPWLAAALWTNAGHPITCFILEFMRLEVGLTEQLINNFTNFINWDLETVNGGAVWLRGGFVYLTDAQGNGELNLLYWLNWYAVNIRNTIYVAGQNGITNTDWWLGTRTEIANSPRLSQNALVSIVTAFAAALGQAADQIMNIILWLWNDNYLVWMYLTGNVNPAIPATDPTDPTSPWASVFDLFMWLIEFIGSIVDFIWSLLTWIVNTLFVGANAPVEAYHSFVAGVESEAYIIDVTCGDSNFWCFFWAGVQLINQTSSQSVIYPFFIIGLIVTSLIIIYLNLYEMFHLNLG